MEYELNRSARHGDDHAFFVGDLAQAFNDIADQLYQQVGDLKTNAAVLECIAIGL